MYKRESNYLTQPAMIHTRSRQCKTRRVAKLAIIGLICTIYLVYFAVIQRIRFGIGNGFHGNLPAFKISSKEFDTRPMLTAPPDSLLFFFKYLLFPATGVG